MKIWRRRAQIGGTLIIVGLALAKIYVEWSAGAERRLSGLSAAASVAALFALAYVLTRTHASRRGHAYLEAMRLAYGGRLKEAVAHIGSPGPEARAFHGAALFLIGLYGFSPLKGTTEAMFAETFSRGSAKRGRQLRNELRRQLRRWRSERWRRLRRRRSVPESAIVRSFAPISSPNRDRIDFLEIIADHYLDASREKLDELDLLRAHFPLVAHGLDLSIGSADGVDPRYLDKIAALIERIDPPWWSEHLCFTRAGGIRIGHLASLPYTQEAIDVVARNVEYVRRRIKTPLILENITSVVRIPGGEMDEPEFLSRTLEATGCGWLCDVANLHVNAINFGVDLERDFERWPWDRLVQIHYAGGRRRDGAADRQP